MYCNFQNNYRKKLFFLLYTVNPLYVGGFRTVYDALFSSSLRMHATLITEARYIPRSPPSTPCAPEERGRVCDPALRFLRAALDWLPPKRCRLSWLTNSVLVYEPKCGGRGCCGVSANKYSCTQEPK